MWGNYFSNGRHLPLGFLALALTHLLQLLPPFAVYPLKQSAVHPSTRQGRLETPSLELQNQIRELNKTGQHA